MPRRLLPGFCDLTERSTDISSLCVGTKGSWEVQTWKHGSASAALSECRRLCESCAACRWISYSSKEQDCSWFTDCDVGRLRHDFNTGHLTLRVRHDNHSLLAHSPAGGHVRRVRPGSRLVALVFFGKHADRGRAQEMLPGAM